MTMTDGKGKPQEFDVIGLRCRDRESGIVFEISGDTLYELVLQKPSPLTLEMVRVAVESAIHTAVVNRKIHPVGPDGLAAVLGETEQRLRQQMGGGQG